MPDGTIHHHQQKRKRAYNKKLEPYPHPNLYVRTLDHIIYGVGFLIPILAFHQSAKLWIEKDASSISIITWVGFIVANIIWVLYGIQHKEKPLIFMYSLLTIANGSILAAALLYG